MTGKPTVIGTGEQPESEDQHTVRPTVISIGTPDKEPVVVRPRVVQFSEEPPPHSATPRVMVVPESPSEPVSLPVVRTPPEPLRPTVFVAPSAPIVPVVPVVQAAPASTQPRVVMGKRRAQIPVVTNDIFMRNPNLDPEVRERVVLAVQRVDVDEIDHRIVVRWGLDEQQVFAALTQRSLDLSMDPLITESVKHIHRMISILGSIDLKKVCGLESRGWFTAKGAAIDTPEELEAGRVELQQLNGRLTASIDKLLALRDKIVDNDEQLQHVGTDIEVLAEAAAFIADYLQQKGSDMAQPFAGRGASLLQSLAHIRSGSGVRTMQVEQPLKIISSIQDATLVAMPGWMSALAQVMALSQGARKPNPTELSDFQQLTSRFLEVLRG